MRCPKCSGELFDVEDLAWSENEKTIVSLGVKHGVCRECYGLTEKNDG